MSSPLFGAPGADNSVRPAREPDLPAIGAVHARSWTGPYAQVLPPALVAAADPGGAGRGLGPRGHLAAHAPVTACTSPSGDGIVAGFVASAPVVHDPTGDDAPVADGSVVELVALEVDPLHQRRGHGSRLLAAVVDTHAGDGTEQLHVWVHVDDAPRAEFLRGAGFAEDGARRRRALAGGDPEDARSVWPEVRLVAWLGGAGTPAVSTAAA